MAKKYNDYLEDDGWGQGASLNQPASENSATGRKEVEREMWAGKWACQPGESLARKEQTMQGSPWVGAKCFHQKEVFFLGVFSGSREASMPKSEGKRRAGWANFAANWAFNHHHQHPPQKRTKVETWMEHKGKKLFFLVRKRMQPEHRDTAVGL